MFKSQELRKLFIDFFKEKNHTVVPSAPLVPKDDPTLLFTSAGMVQFKKLYTGEVPLPYRRAVSIQKCLRASDIDEVGKTNRHHTFFEMLGNFSFGDYFKMEAICWAWDFITKWVNLPQDRLFISIYKEDDESYNIWRDIVGIDEAKILKEGAEDNFWGPAGKTGPCGPCSEILFDKEVEIWNLVFPQYDQKEDGTRAPLKNRGIDTGMGFERLTMVCQNKESTYETDLFKPIVDEISNIVEVNYGEHRIPINIIADHVRGLVFALSEGIYPSNEGRGYLIRRLLRRALREGHALGMMEPFLFRLVGVVADVMREPYPELLPKRENIALIIRAEEESFLRTIEQGERFFEQIVEEKGKITGEEAFKLYDTYGFPPELTETIAKERGIPISLEGFDEAMRKQKERARAKSRFATETVGLSDKVTFEHRFHDIKETKFIGYDKLKGKTRIARYSPSGGKVEIILEETPFYAEAGGQVGDTGRIYSKSFEVQVEDTRIKNNFITHIGVIRKGSMTNEKVTCEVDAERRKQIERNHTATHLLQAALRKVLGEHVHQEGSLVAPDRMRFDFTHFAALTPSEIRSVEEQVNSWIRANIPVKTYETSYDEAIKAGAIALFEEKYGAKKVRVVKIGDISKEVCAGTHVKATGEIGVFKILGESSVHAGIRRLEVITGDHAFSYLTKCAKEISSLAEELKTSVHGVKDRVYEIMEREKKLESKVKILEEKALLGQIPDILANKTEVMKIEVIASKVRAESIEGLRKLCDKLRKAKQRVGVLGSAIGGRALFISFVTDDLKSKIKAGDIAKEVGKLVGGSGGGKPHLAQAGGKDIKAINKALSQVPNIVKKLL